MSGARYELIRQLSSGPDGVRYLASDRADAATVRIDRLFGAQRSPERWRLLKPRLRLVSQLYHPHLLAVRALELDGQDPYVVRDHSDVTLKEVLTGPAADRPRALGQLAGLADALAAAHRVGVVHGRLGLDEVYIGRDESLVLDPTGIRTVERVAGGEITLLAQEPASGVPEDDVYGLGVLMSWLLAGQGPTVDAEGRTRSPGLDDVELDALLAEMLAADPALRPKAAGVRERLDAAGATRISVSPLSSTQPAPSSGGGWRGQRLGRFVLEDLLGEGGMGRVYRARDISDDSTVALKILHSHWCEEAAGLGRFYREARVLAHLDNPHIARFVEVNEDSGVHYLAMELVDGIELDRKMVAEGPLPVAEALEVLQQVAMALADVHDLGVVHRDVKPANILLVERGSRRVAKLCDFGIARAVGSDETAAVTRAGIAVGTPQYMAPEQCVGSAVDARADIYALGITAYKMLTGTLPFDSPDTRALVLMHLHEAPPSIRERCPELGDAAVRVIERMLAKSPDERYPNARALLEDLARLRRGEASDIELHPRLPDSAGTGVLRYDFEWQLAATPAELWPYVSNTERLNRAIGLGAVDYRRQLDDGQVETFGNVRLRGLELDWQEHPYEWVAPHRMGILREFSQGPFLWLLSKVELIPSGRGTLLRHRIALEPRGVLGRAASEIEMRVNTKRALDRVYRRIDRFLEARRSANEHRSEADVSHSAVTALREAPFDPFEAVPELSEIGRRRLAEGHQRLLDRGAEPAATERLCHYIARAPAQEAGRIRPRALARRFGLDDRELLRACLHAAAEGLLVLLYDVICPRCQIPSNIEESLKNLHEHQRCDACNLDFEADFGSSIEVIFRVHPNIRDSELGTYCIGGPGHTPHVIAQVRLAPGERFELELSLDEGSYSVTGRQLPFSWPFSVRDGAPLESWELPLSGDVSSSSMRVLSAGRQRIVLSNDQPVELVARVERASGRGDAVTAAEIACSKLFRELFPSEVLAKGQLVSIQRIILLVGELCDPWSEGDEAAVFERLSRLSRRVDEVVSEHGGAVIKLIGDGVLAAFSDPLAACRAALALLEAGELPPARWALHAGSAMVTSINDRLDYFGRVVHEVAELLRTAKRGQLVIGEPVFGDPAVSHLLAAIDTQRELVTVGDLVGQSLGATPTAA